MNYLIQAYACSPDRGGEFGVSWGWITHLYREVNDNDNIYIVSLTLKKQDLAEHNLERCHMIDIPNLGRYEFLHYNDLFHYIWLREAYKAVKKLVFISISFRDILYQTIVSQVIGTD
ncbi:MAG: hypothetical protein MR488_06360 [Lachnospiraceae bacterium]|nr:hypothetical protein [Lachnospiraceae bacterium]